MARHLALEPFRAVRYAPERVSDLGAVTSPPYDMLDDDAVAALRRAEPHNVVRLTLDPDGPEAAARRLASWRSEGVLITDPEPALYGYERRVDDRVVQRGLLGALALRDPTERVVLAHENVMPGPVAGRLALLRETEANLEPLLLTYDGVGGEIREILAEPGEDLVDASTPRMPDSVDRSSAHDEHRIWRIDDPEIIATIATDLRDRRALIADGHHRYAAARALRAERGTPGPWDSVLALLVDHGRYPPHVGAIHRAVGGISLETVTRVTAGSFQSTPTVPTAAQDIPPDAAVVTDGRQWIRLTPPPGDGLPVHAVDDTLLRTLLGIPEEGVRYVHDLRAAVRAAERDEGVAFLLPAARAHDVLELASRDRTMPRKSTSFGPKPRTGLVMRTFDSA